MFDCYYIAGSKAAFAEFDKMDERKMCLVLCTNPVETDIVRISEKTGISPDEIKDAIHKDTAPRVDVRETCLIISYRAPHVRGSRTITMPAVIFVRKNLIMAVFRSPLKNIDTLHTILSQGIAPPVFREGIAGIVYSLFDKINDEFFDALDEISVHAEVFEKQIHRLSREDTKSIYSLNLTLAYFQRALAGNREVLKVLACGEVPGFSGERARRIFSDLQKDVLEIVDAEEIQKSTINNMFNLQSTILSNELNEGMKMLAAIGAIILAPTLLAGIYGMNISGLPFAEHRYSFHIVLFMLLGVAGLVALYFRKRGWI